MSTDITHILIMGGITLACAIIGRLARGADSAEFVANLCAVICLIATVILAFRLVF